jgi:hypothetical protein
MKRWKVDVVELQYGNEISVEDYNMLREVVKWGAIEKEQAHCVIPGCFMNTTLLSSFRSSLVVDNTTLSSKHHILFRILL